MNPGSSKPSTGLLLTPNRTMRRLVHEALLRLGHDPEQVHDQAMCLSGGAHPDYHDQAPLFWSRITDLINDPNAGLHLAEAAHVRLLDEIFLMMYLSRDLREALKRLVHFRHLLSGGFAAELQDDGAHREAALVVNLDYPGFGVLRQQAECVTLMLIRLLAFCTDNRFRITGVDFRHAAPAEQGEHQRLFSVTPRFSEHQDRLLFDARLLDQPLPASSPELAAALERYAEERLRTLEVNQFLYRVRFWIDRHLENPNLDMDDCARHFGLSRIGLRRTLGARNVLFQDLCNDLRRQRAGEMLAQGESISTTARTCGFASAPAFEDAFRNWFGCAPQHYQQRRRCPNERCQT